ncbi:MAG: polysulfide reductase-like protein, subunit [Firmicutes bacterium]|nr:polysulfide reductase-like protein, subunit [Bacillota bacterium]
MADKKWAMVYDANKCIACQACSVACRVENNVPENLYRLQVQMEGPNGVYPKLGMNFHRQSCVMCNNPPCVPVCPTGASHINNEGVTLVDNNKCIGCKYCIVACPYKARFVNSVTSAADKCTFCWGTRVSKGQKPACVEQCITGALLFGDLNDPNSEVNVYLRNHHHILSKEHLNTKPKLYIIPSQRGGVKA